MTRIFTAYLLITLTSVALADKATCQFSQKSIKIHKSQTVEYTCALSVGSPDSFVTVTDIDGEHDGKSDEDVKVLIFDQSMKLEAFSSVFCQKFPNLKAIKIENVDVNSIDAESLQECSDLKLFYLNSNNVREIPETLFSENGKLLEIMITSNMLNTLPEDTFEMQDNLKILKLNSNKINDLPDKIFVALKNLEYLNLDQNQLKTLNPRWFEELVNLNRLSIASNRIAELPEGVFNSLTNLETLILRSNSLTVISSNSFSIRTKIKNLELSFNQIDSIDPKFVNNSQLSLIFMLNNICSSTKTSNKNQIRTALASCFKNFESRFGSQPTLPTSRLSTETTTIKPKIRNEKLFKRGAYPWIAAIMKKNGDYYCGAVLVSSRKIVTTAKCMYKYERAAFRRMTKGDFTVVLGSHDLTSPSEQGRIIPTVSEIKIHPNFNIESLKNDFDIAVIVLAAPVSFTGFVRSINLIDDGSEPGDVNVGHVVSHGHKENRKLTAISAPKVLNTIILTSESCILESQAIIYASGTDTFCIDKKSSDAVCIEDIGSGLFVKHDGGFYLRGILSYVIAKDVDQCDDETFSIYTDVPKFTKWIRSIPEVAVQPSRIYDDRPLW